MADTKSRLQFLVSIFGEEKLKKLVKDISRVEKAMHNYGRGIATDLDKADGRWKKHFDYLDKATKAAGGALTSFVGKSAKFATLQVGALGVAMMAVHGAFVLGNATMKAFRGLAQLAAGAAAGLTIALAAAAAAVREQQAAMFAYKGKGKNEFGSGLNQIRVEMRGLMADASLAAVGTENLNAAFSSIAKSAGGFNQGAQALFKGLMDFASAGQDIKTGSKAAADLVAALNDPKASFSKVTEAAKALGPEMTKALEEAKKTGVDTTEELKAAILDGSLAVAGGVQGQFKAFNSTLINQGKAAFQRFKNMFADMGLPFLEPLKVELKEVENALKRAFISVYGDIETFAQGNFLDNVSVVVEKLANFLVRLIHEYLPKVDGMFSRMGGWWSRFKDGWNMILDTVRPLIDAARVLENAIKEVFAPLGKGMGDAFEQTRDLIVENETEFLRFGAAIGRFITEFSEFSGAIRKIFIDALPFLTKVVDGATALFDIFTSLLGTLQKFTGGMGVFGPMMLPALLMSGGRGMKKTIGGQVFQPNKVSQMDVKADRVTVNTPQGRDLRRGTSLEERMNRRRAAEQGAYSGAQRSSRSTKQISKSAGAPTAAPVTPAVAMPALRPSLTHRLTKSPDQLRAMYPGFDPNKMVNPKLNPDGTIKQGIIRGGLTNMRESRKSLAAVRMMGGEYGTKQYKGFNNSMGGMAAASLGLGLLSNVAGEEAQGSLALGSMVGMYNPMAGLAVGLGGAALTSTTALGGSLMGAGSGAAIGTMIAPGIGTAVGAIIGGIAGGIAGALNGDKKARAAARKAGETAMRKITDSAIEGMQANVRRQGISALTTHNIGKQFDSILNMVDKTITGFTELAESGASDDALRAFMNQQRQSGEGMFATMTQGDFDAMLKKPADAVTSLMKNREMLGVAAQTLEDTYTARLPYFAEALGKSEAEILKLAEATGTNLMDATMQTNEMIKSLAKGMIDSFRDVQMAAGQAMGSMADIFSTAADQIKSVQAINENMRNIRDRIDNKALQGEEGRLQLLESFTNVLPQMIAAKGGDQIAALYEFRRQFDLKEGTAFTAAGGPLEGQAGVIAGLIGPELRQSLNFASNELGRILTENVTATLAQSNVQLGAGQAAKLNAAIQSGRLNELETTQIMQFLQNPMNDMTSESAQKRFADMVNKMDSTLRINIEDMSAPIEAAAKDFTTATSDFKAAVETLIKAFPQPPDTRSPRAFGDTSSNLANTMSAHNQLTSGIPGKRTVTSSYRNFALGSLKSDHLTGNALDLVGDNLVSYRDAVNRSGGFAEFHGGLGSGRHLHVVPNSSAIGDSSIAVASQTTGNSGSRVTVNNTFNISGTSGSSEELVNSIIARINSSIRDARERT